MFSIVYKYWQAKQIDISHVALLLQHIWCYVPCIRCLKINCSVVRDVTTIILQALYGNDSFYFIIRIL
jgi:hypothetical protein